MSSTPNDPIQDETEKITEFIMSHYPPLSNLFDYDTSNKQISQSLQDRIDSFLELKKANVHFNDKLTSNREFKNPNIYLKLLEYADLDEYASNIDKSVFDPSLLPDFAFYKNINETQKLEHERRSIPKLNHPTTNQ